MATSPTASPGPDEPVAYPVHVRGDPAPSVARWLWLVKWLLLVPHLLALVLLWIVFAVLTLVAFFAILITGRYPRALFDVNVGILRWSWRVTYYGYGVLATDRYPPFTFADVADYPAHLDVDYPDHLSRSLVLVKWWLLALPHYVIVGVLVGGGSWWANRHDALGRIAWSSGLVGILVLVAAVVLMFTGRYPQPLYALIVGLQRWVLRVVAYAALMTDAYPPFRLDQGPDDPGSPGVGTASEGPRPPTEEGRETPRVAGWTAGRVTGVLLGSLVAVVSVLLLIGGFAMTVADTALRDSAGYVTTTERPTNSSGYAVALTSVVIDAPPGASALPQRVLGQIRLRVTPSARGIPVFVGIASSAAVDRYLGGVARTVTQAQSGSNVDLPGSAPTAAPTRLAIWDASASGTGTQELRWVPRAGDWAVVVMNADGTAGVAATASVGATLPWLGRTGTALLVGGLVLLAGGVTLVTLAIRRATAHPRRDYRP